MAQDNRAGSDGAGLSPDEWWTFKWLALGHALFAMALLAVVLFQIELGNIWITPLFGLPLVLAGSGKSLWVRAAVFLFGFTALHYLAMTLALGVAIAEPDKIIPKVVPFVPGLAGGLLGGVGSLMLCAVGGLMPRSWTAIRMAVVGTLFLAAVGAVGFEAVVRAFDLTPGPGPLLYFLLYTPWQLAFAYVLAKLLRCDRPQPAH